MGPKLRQRVKAQFSLNGGWCHGFVSEEVHGGIQGGGGTAAGIGGVTGRVARTCEVNLNVLHRWRRELREDREKVFPGIGPAAGERKPGGGLERKIGQQALEIDFLRRCLQRVEEQRRLQALTGKPLSTNKSSKK